MTLAVKSFHVVSWEKSVWQFITWRADIWPLQRIFLCIVSLAINPSGGILCLRYDFDSIVIAKYTHSERERETGREREKTYRFWNMSSQKPKPQRCTCFSGHKYTKNKCKLSWYLNIYPALWSNSVSAWHVNNSDPQIVDTLSRRPLKGQLYINAHGCNVGFGLDPIASLQSKYTCILRL